MFELITQILILVGLYYLLKALWPSIYNTKYFAWFGVAVLISLIFMAFIYPTNRTIGILWAILSFPLRPLGLTLVLLAYALTEGWKKVKGQQVLAAFLVLLICSLPITAYLLTAQTEQRSVLEAINQQERTNPRQVQAIVVLGDTMTLDPSARIHTQIDRPSTGISVTLQSRLIYAAELYLNRSQRGSNPWVIVSVGPLPVDADGRPITGENQTVINVLTANGVPQSQIQIDNIGIDPRSSAVAIRRLLLGPEGENVDCRIFAFCDNGARELKQASAPGVRVPIVLVAPAIMIRRASSTFTRVYFEVTPCPTDFYIFQLQRGWGLAALTDLLPSAEALVITSRVVNEYLATVYYFIRGWLADPLAV
ncbi:MAG: YdcF family protein [Elainella sp. Prado103]|jgi:hypothetical protein|nr:YdcF family protein [Elainella sp. Prado103]